jgi:putative endonuclease
MAERPDRRKAFLRGHGAERLAAFALMLKGYRILARRFKTPLGEVDLIARRGEVLAIVEVKARRDLVAAMEAVTPSAERRIEAAGDLFLSRLPDHGRLSIRYDLVAVLPRRWPVHVENVFYGRF